MVNPFTAAKLELYKRLVRPWLTLSPNDLLDLLGDAEADIEDAIELKIESDAANPSGVHSVIVSCNDEKIWFLIREYCGVGADHVIENPGLYGLMPIPKK